MALTNAQYLALINDIFADNTTQEITEADLRNFGVKTSELLFLGTGTGSLGLAYDAARTYDVTLDGEFLYAEYNDKLWKYIDAVPQSGITPVEGVSWTEVSKSAGSSIVEWVFEAVYAEGLIIVFFNNRLYKLLEPIRPYQTTDLPAELIAGDWLDLTANEVFKVLTDAATVLWDFNDSINAVVTLGGNRTLAISNVPNGSVGVLKVIQDVTGSRTLILPVNSNVISGGSGAITLTTTANAVDFISFIYDGTDYNWNIGPNYN